MKLTKKDFKKIAEIIKSADSCGQGDFAFGELSAIETITDSFVEWFKSENSDFDEQKFREEVSKV